ncbi:uncharacterized protein LOC133797213 [Humulus lupulus]|uniref:uncharacterized protein LOC133797213 n=1 Tax=Humulus lupulus TaxID=3486 RepID=UPI002B40FDE3|nr:uncharacterized protein LOC133797213 [Humulus lupulus]
MEVFEAPRNHGARASAVATEKRKRDEADLDYVIDDDILAWLSGEDESSSRVSDQLMELLDATAAEEESSPSGAAKVRFIENPYMSQLIFQTTPSSYVTINGNEESCGSSFSDWDSSVMASVDTTGVVGTMTSQMMGPAGSFEEVELDLDSSLNRWLDDEFEAAEMDGAWGSSEDGLIDCDGDPLARFLSEIFSEKSLA